MTDSEIQTVGFLIFPGFPMACLTSMIEPLRAANEIAGVTRFAWVLISEDGAQVTSSAQVGFDADEALSARRTLDFLFLLGSPVSQFRNPNGANGTLRALARRGLTIGAVSGGVFPLVRAGLMAGHRCSVHWCYDAAFRAEFPQIEAASDVIVRDRRRFTVSGSAAAFDLSLWMIENALGPEISHEVACWFQHPLMRGEGVRQALPLHPTAEETLPDLVSRAIGLFAADLESALSINDIAAQLHVTPRQVERAFKKAVHQSPSHYFRALRMKAARQLVQYSKDSIAEIAQAVGYGSAAPLLRHYRAAFGVTPAADRAKINAFRVQGHGVLPHS